MDWRDALPINMNKYLLANQLLLVDMYDLAGRHDRSLSLRGAIQESFYSKERGYFADFVWWDGNTLRNEVRFDSLGNSLAILNDTAAGDLAESVVRALGTVQTEFGYRNLFPPYQIDRAGSLTNLTTLRAFLRNGAVFRNRRHHYQNSSIWPFIEAKIIRALLKLGMNAEAEKATRMVLSRSGCNEWYSPITGAPKGSGRQLWTAAAILEVADATSLD
jgi:glycogen debranching enzyme